MMTLTEKPTELDPRELRIAALAEIAVSDLPGYSTAAALKPVAKQVADEILLLAWCGFTPPVARAVFAERDRARRSARTRPYSPEQVRREIRAVAEAGLLTEGPAVIGIFRQVADQAEQDGNSTLCRSFLEFAAVAEELLAGRGAASLN